LALLTCALAGCFAETVCEPRPGPPPSCVRFAQQGRQFLMVLTPACGIFDQDVTVDSIFGVTENVVLHMDSEGRSSPPLLVGEMSNDELEISYGGGGCPTRFCVQLNGSGAARECTLSP
jgi:hypothetical protein